MKHYPPSGPGACDNDENDDENEFLLAYDAYIKSEVHHVLPPELFSGDTLDLEIDDLIQMTRIKLWASHQKRPIRYPKAYIRTIARTTVIDRVRCYRPTVSLFGDEDEEPDLSDSVVSQSEGLRDPSYEIELEEIDADLLTKLVEAILALPDRQRQALFYTLKESKDDTFPLIKALEEHGIDIEAGNWPDVHLLRASLVFARKKLQWILAEFMLE